MTREVYPFIRLAALYKMRCPMTLRTISANMLAQFANKSWRRLKLVLPPTNVDIAVLSGMTMKETAIPMDVPEAYLDFPDALALGVFVENDENGDMQSALLPWRDGSLTPVYEMVSEAFQSWSVPGEGLVMNFARFGPAHFVAGLAEAGRAAAQNFTAFIKNSGFAYSEMLVILSRAERRGEELLYGRRTTLANPSAMDGDEVWDDACRRYHLALYNPVKRLRDPEDFLLADLPFIFANGMADWVQVRAQLVEATEVLALGALSKNNALEESFFVDFLGQLPVIRDGVGALFQGFTKTVYHNSRLLDENDFANGMIVDAFDAAAEKGIGPMAVFAAFRFYRRYAVDRDDLFAILFEQLQGLKPLPEMTVGSLINVLRKEWRNDNLAEMIHALVGSVNVRYDAPGIREQDVRLPISRGEPKRRRFEEPKPPPPTLPPTPFLESLPSSALVVILTNDPVVSLRAFSRLSSTIARKTREATETPGFFEAYVARAFPKMVTLRGVMRTWIGQEEYDAVYNRIYAAVGNEARSQALLDNWAWREVFVSTLVEIANASVFVDWDVAGTDFPVAQPEHDRFLEKLQGEQMIFANDTFGEYPWTFTFSERDISKYEGQLLTPSDNVRVPSDTAQLNNWKSVEPFFPKTLREAFSDETGALGDGTEPLPETRRGKVTCGGTVLPIALYEAGTYAFGVYKVPVRLSVKPVIGVKFRDIAPSQVNWHSYGVPYEANFVRLIHKTVLPALPEKFLRSQ